MKPQKLTHILMLIVAIGLLPNAQAVVPPPDGGYPNFTTAEGTNALRNLTTGAGNTGVGWYSLFSDTDGSFNTATGAGSLLFNTGSSNTAIGTASLLFNIDGSDNTALGAAALLNNTGSGNTAVGSNTLLNSTSSFSNTAIGHLALASNTLGSENTATGTGALLHNDTGNANTATGTDALRSNLDGLQNTASGYQALFNNTTGDENTAIGYNTLFNNSSGSNNVALGALAESGVTTTNNVICIGAAGENVSNSCYVGNIFGSTASGGIAVLINSSGKLGTSPSSQRFKEQIRPMDKTSEALYSLEPVTFRYKKDMDPAGTSQFGLVAEEVEKVNRDLVVRDKEGKPYSVRYDQVNAMLLNKVSQGTSQGRGAGPGNQPNEIGAGAAAENI
jgi:trimeric autotransporter adhesin